jgi:hypothetical protein
VRKSLSPNVVWRLLENDGGPEILHGEFPLEGRYDPLQKCYIGDGEDNIINVKQQVYHICATPEDEYRGVGLGLNKVQGGGVRGELVVSSPRRLL